LDVISVTETWLNDNVSNNEIFPSGYNIIRKDRPSNKRGGGVLLALREGIQYNRVNSGSWSDQLEILSTEIESHQINAYCVSATDHRTVILRCFFKWLKNMKKVS
jgi:hypothetical protein